MRTVVSRFVLFVTTTGLSLGLAILGWGGWDAYFADPARLALAATTLILSAVAVFSSGNVSAGVREDRGNRWVLAVFSILGLLLGYVPAYTDRVEFWTIDGGAVRWAGVVLFAAGGALRIWPVFVLGRRFSGLVAIQPEHTLVTGGIYRFIRHPSYLGLITSALGWALAFRSIVGVVIVLLFLPPLVARMRAEERLLSSQFGAEYDAYRARTPRLFPRLWHAH
jgi:protein-S-isoprenylcysteine O-methyltransferase Ste14